MARRTFVVAERGAGAFGHVSLATFRRFLEGEVGAPFASEGRARVVLVLADVRTGAQEVSTYTRYLQIPVDGDARNATPVVLWDDDAQLREHPFPEEWNWAPTDEQRDLVDDVVTRVLADAHVTALAWRPLAGPRN
jgi:hypothetical protein